jgi:hypothetical protein
MDPNLIRVLEGAGKAVETIGFPDGSEVLLSPYGGRILGLFTKGDARNFYWVNSALRQVGTARKFFSKEQWQNIGGERTWLGPEIDFFFPRFPDLSVYRQPLEIDAATFKVEKAPGSIRLATGFEILSNRHRQSVRLRLAKSVAPAPNPLRSERGFPMPEGVGFAGYTLRTTLEFADAAAPAVPVGLWSLTQMPHGGEMIIPTYGRAEPVFFFGKAPRGDLSAKPALVRYRMRSVGAHKIGLRAFSTTGRLAYFYESPRAAQLVVRNFFGNPSGEYVDSPWTDPGDPGYCVQACSIGDPTADSFSELEYHIPAIGGESGRTHAEDLAQVWAYRGSRGEIASIAEKLLGIPAGSL